MEEGPWHRHYDYCVQTEYRFPRVPLHSLLDIPANAFPDKAASRYYGSEITFWELREAAIRLANVLAELGVQKGDREETRRLNRNLKALPGAC